MSKVLPVQYETEVYLNTDSDVVVKQTRHDGDEVHIIIRPQNIHALCKALYAAGREARGVE